MSSLDRDFYAEGYDAAACGRSDLAPSDVTVHGPEAEAEWNDGYNEFMEDCDRWAGDDDLSNFGGELN